MGEGLVLVLCCILVFFAIVLLGNRELVALLRLYGKGVHMYNGVGGLLC